MRAGLCIWHGVRDTPHMRRTSFSQLCAGSELGGCLLRIKSIAASKNMSRFSWENDISIKLEHLRARLGCT